MIYIADTPNRIGTSRGQLEVWRTVFTDRSARTTSPLDARAAGFIVYRRMNVVVAPYGSNRIKSNLSVWNSCSQAGSAMVRALLDLCRNCGIATAGFGEDHISRERKQAYTFRELD
jgi:hypothetical protein